MKFSLQSTHWIVRSGCSTSGLAANSMICSLSDMMFSPLIGPLASAELLAGRLTSERFGLGSKGVVLSWRVIGVSACYPRSGYMRQKV